MGLDDGKWWAVCMRCGDVYKLCSIVEQHRDTRDYRCRGKFKWLPQQRAFEAAFKLGGDKAINELAKEIVGGERERAFFTAVSELFTAVSELLGGR